LARDLAAILGARLHLPAATEVEPSIQDTRPVSHLGTQGLRPLLRRIIRGIDARARTPGWMVRRLERAGLRAISPLVDVTNFVMLERGQPMHAFDDARLRGAVGVRFMKPGERVKLLNEQEVDHRPGLLAITDETGPIALGGVMGGHGSMVGDATTDVFFEAAFFDPVTVQGKARDLGIASDAAYRFERGVDPAGTLPALERATALTLEICGGRAGPVVRADGELPRRDPVLVRPARVRELLGYDVPDGDMRALLARLSCRPERSPSGALEVTPPSWRFDLALEEDYVEEVARIHGYEHVPDSAPRAAVPMVHLREGHRGRFDLRHLLADLGYQEVINYSFVAEAWGARLRGQRAPDPSREPYREPHGGDAHNPDPGAGSDPPGEPEPGRGPTCASSRSAAASRVRSPTSPSSPERIAGLAYGGRLPEQWGVQEAVVDFYDAKGDLEALAGPMALQFTAGSHPACHPGRCAVVTAGGRPVGIVGELHPRLQQANELASAPVVFELLTAPLFAGSAPAFKGVSRMPPVRRDYAFTVAESTPAGAILEAVRTRVPPFVREVEVFDLYRGKGVEPGRKSLALRIVMQDTDRTLTDSEVEAVMASVREQINEQFQAQPRT
jgi:phenylalanyl-tRNA synthetase beta chain